MPWDYNTIEYRKQAEKDEIWGLERLVNYGLGGNKLNKEKLKKHLSQLCVPEDRRAFLELLLWNQPF